VIVARNASTRSSSEGLKEVDVLVIGSGAAGSAAALAAHDAGAQVLVVEKREQAGGNSLVSSANTVYPARPDDVQRFCRYLTEVRDGTTPAEVIEAYVHGLVQLPAPLVVVNSTPRTFSRWKTSALSSSRHWLA
jgi:succinate dehydrogenase/fumarate reductase flavoprotein subunit